MVLGGDVPEVVIAPLGDEVRLRDDGDAALVARDLAQEPHGRHVGNRGVFDAVSRQRAGVAQRGQREDQFRTCHAVKGHWPPPAVSLGNAFLEAVKVGKNRVVQHDFQRPAFKRFVSHQVHALAEVEFSVEGLGRLVVRVGGVRDAGDAVAGQQA